MWLRRKRKHVTVCVAGARTATPGAVVWGSAGVCVGCVGHGCDGGARRGQRQGAQPRGVLRGDGWRAAASSPCLLLLCILLSAQGKRVITSGVPGGALGAPAAAAAAARRARAAGATGRARALSRAAGGARECDGDGAAVPHAAAGHRVPRAAGRARAPADLARAPADFARLARLARLAASQDLRILHVPDEALGVSDLTEPPLSRVLCLGRVALAHPQGGHGARAPHRTRPSAPAATSTASPARHRAIPREPALHPAPAAKHHPRAVA